MTREEILRRFEAWLDAALAAEEPPRGIGAEILAEIAGYGDERTPAAPSTYTLWEAMTALTQEVKLQGRSFKELNDTLAAQAGRSLDRERDLPREIERRCRKEFLGVLIELRDRLGRGLESVRSAVRAAQNERRRSRAIEQGSRRHRDRGIPQRLRMERRSVSTGAGEGLVRTGGGER